MGVTADKELAFRAIINTWLKDKTRYCCQCGKTTFEMEDGKCCDDQMIGNNMQVCEAIILQNKDIRESRKNDFGSTDDKSIRWGVSLPPSLFYTIDKWKRANCNNVGLFSEKNEINWFAKKFPVFATCNRI